VDCSVQRPTVASPSYSAVAIALHWATAAAIVVQILLGWRLDDVDGELHAAIIALHISVGLTVLLLSVARLMWRLKHAPPPEVDVTRLESRLSRLVHGGFYLALLSLPLTGWMMSSAARSGGFTLFGLIPWPRFPLLSYLPPAAQDKLADILDTGHSALAWVLVGLLVLHVAGALKHHFISGDRVVPRMVPGARPGALLESRLLAIVAAVLVLSWAAYAVHAPRKVLRPRPASLAAADIFLDVVQPALERRCASCHSEDRSRGGLSVASYKSILRGGRTGPGVVPRVPPKSEIFKRVTLPANHEKYMPKDGKTALTPAQVDAIKWWISIGAPATAKVAALTPPSAVAASIAKVLHLSGSDSDSGGGALDVLAKVPPGDPAAIAALQQSGFTVRLSAKDSNLLDVNLYAVRSVTDTDINALAKLKDQLRSLILRNAAVQDAALGTLGQMPHLTLLNLPGNPITDAGVAKLSGLKNLWALDLYGTQVTDAVLPTLSELPRLEKVYLWNTRVTAPSGTAFQRAHPKPRLILDDSPGDPSGAAANDRPRK
jgi:cytochrome b561